MHKKDLESNRHQEPRMSLASGGSLTNPESWPEVSELAYVGNFFYRVRREACFLILLVILSQFSLSNSKVLTLAHWIASWVSSTSKTLFHGIPKYVSGQVSVDSVTLGL